MDIAALKAFTAVADAGSFSAAAEHLFLTQPAISKRIAALESELDAKLFDRIGRTITLTEAGRALLPRAPKIQVELGDRPKSFRNPRIETDEYIATTGFARPAEAAFGAALEDLIHWMVDEFGFRPTDAHMLLAQVLEARVTQFVNPLFTYLCKVQRQYLIPG